MKRFPMQERAREAGSDLEHISVTINRLRRIDPILDEVLKRREQGRAA